MNDNASSPTEREVMLQDLLVRLTTHWHDPRNEGKPQLLLGTLPQLPIELPLPEGGRVVGTLIYGPERADIVLDIPLPPPQIIAFYKERLAADGWTEPDAFRGHRPTGFMHSGFPGRDNTLTLCKGVGDPGLTIQAHSDQGTMTDVRVHIEGNEFTPCAQQRGPKSARRTGHPGFYELIPQIAPPEGARQMGGGGSSNQDAASQSATLETDAELAILIPHYARQLENVGWTRTDEGQSGPIAWNAWTFKDEDNEPWRGFFFILKRPGREREYSLFVEIKWDSNEKPTTGWFSYSRINS